MNRTIFEPVAAALLSESIVVRITPNGGFHGPTMDERGPKRTKPRRVRHRLVSRGSAHRLGLALDLASSSLNSMELATRVAGFRARGLVPRDMIIIVYPGGRGKHIHVDLAHGRGHSDMEWLADGRYGKITIPPRFSDVATAVPKRKAQLPPERDDNADMESDESEDTPPSPRPSGARRSYRERLLERVRRR